MELVNATLSGGQLAELLMGFDMMPDELAQNPSLLGVIAASSQFFWIRSGRRLLGVVWLSDIIPGSSANVHVLVAKRHRKFMRPEKLSKSPAKDQNSRGKLDAFALLADLCFVDLGLRRLTAPIPESRRAAVRLARRLGFSREGKIRSGVAFNGKSEDVWIFGLTKEDWYGMGSSSSRAL